MEVCSICYNINSNRMCNRVKLLQHMVLEVKMVFQNLHPLANRYQELDKPLHNVSDLVLTIFSCWIVTISLITTTSSFINANLINSVIVK